MIRKKLKLLLNNLSLGGSFKDMEMSGSDVGNTAQIRAVAEQVGEASADIAIRRFIERHGLNEVRPAVEPEAKMPSPLKWAGIIAAAVMTACATGFFYWMATTINEVQMTMIRIDTRQELRDKTTADAIAKLQEDIKHNSDRISNIEQRGIK